ncbi:MAG: glycosyltransferase family 1 protein [Microcystaceae cyanobacterium]
MVKSHPVVQFISIVPNLVGEGHTTPYHQAVGQAIQLLGWNHRVFVPEKAANFSLKDNWLSCLYSYDLEAEANLFKKIFNFYHTIRLGISLAQGVNKNSMDKSSMKILFLERFIHFQLLAVWVAVLLLPRQNLSVWLLYRRDTHKSKTVKLYKMLNQWIENLLPKGQFKLLTDSELLSQSLSKSFNKMVHVVPIPHTDFQDEKENYLGLESNILWCWWPGSPRLEKGWTVIQSLSQIPFNKGDEISLIAAQNANLVPNSQGIKLKLLPNHLSRQDYNQWLLNCDIILLPYEPLAYQERTSGIFTEAIIAGKIPCVTPNTWMAYELQKYKLEKDLVIQWENPKVALTQLLEIKNNPQINDKLKEMQTAYQNFHNVKQYSQCLQQLFGQSFP